MFVVLGTQCYTKQFVQKTGIVTFLFIATTLNLALELGLGVSGTGINDSFKRSKILSAISGLDLVKLNFIFFYPSMARFHFILTIGHVTYAHAQYIYNVHAFFIESSLKVGK